MGVRWIVSTRTRGRLAVSLAVLGVFGVGLAWCVVDAISEPSVPSVVLALIVGSAFVAGLVMAGEAFGSGFVRLDEAGYRVPLGTPRRWSDVLAVGTAAIEGRCVPALALRAEGGFPITQDVFTGFADADGETLLAELRSRTPDAPGEFSSVRLPDSWWTGIEVEASRIRTAVAASGREPSAERRTELGYPGLATAVTLDYGINESGEGVQVVVHGRSDLALVVNGVRYLRQDRKRTPDAADEVGTLFVDHTTELRPASELGLPQAIVTVEGRRPLRFNAEEPDRFN